MTGDLEVVNEAQHWQLVCGQRYEFNYIGVHGVGVFKGYLAIPDSPPWLVMDVIGAGVQCLNPVTMYSLTPVETKPSS